MRDSKRLEQTVQAMKNVIEGYGDRYVMPTAGLLDDLAAEFGFGEAGQRLKAAREKVRSMIKEGKARHATSGGESPLDGDRVCARRVQRQDRCDPRRCSS